MVWFGWNFLHRLILGWHLSALHFLPSKFPRIPKMFPLFLNIFLLFDLNETSYLHSFWDGNCEIFTFFRNYPSSLKTNLSIFFNTFPLSDLYETSYIDTFMDGINSRNSPPPPNSPPFSQKPLPIFEHFPIVRFGWHFLHRFILGDHVIALILQT